jgi:hypothetical protein
LSFPLESVTLFLLCLSEKSLKEKWILWKIPKEISVNSTVTYRFQLQCSQCHHTETALLFPFVTKRVKLLNGKENSFPSSSQTRLKSTPEFEFKTAVIVVAVSFFCESFRVSAETTRPEG